MKAPHILFQRFVHQSSFRPVQPEFNSFSPSFCERLWERFFTLDSQLRVTQKRDRAGDNYYQIDDPLSGKTQTFFSEEEAIAWLERQRS